MLEFWFSSQLSPLQKLLIACTILILSIVLYLKFPIAPTSMLMFFATGLLFLICRYVRLHFLQDQPVSIWARLMTWIPLALLFAVIFMQHQQRDLLIFGIQGICFMALGIFLFSPQYLFLSHPPQSSESK